MALGKPRGVCREEVNWEQVEAYRGVTFSGCRGGIGRFLQRSAKAESSPLPGFSDLVLIKKLLHLQINVLPKGVSNRHAMVDPGSCPFSTHSFLPHWKESHFYLGPSIAQLQKFTFQVFTQLLVMWQFWLGGKQTHASGVLEKLLFCKQKRTRLRFCPNLSFLKHWGDTPRCNCQNPWNLNSTVGSLYQPWTVCQYFFSVTKDNQAPMGFKPLLLGLLSNL